MYSRYVQEDAWQERHIAMLLRAGIIVRRSFFVTPLLYYCNYCTQLSILFCSIILIMVRSCCFFVFPLYFPGTLLRAGIFVRRCFRFCFVLLSFCCPTYFLKPPAPPPTHLRRFLTRLIVFSSSLFPSLPPHPPSSSLPPSTQHNCRAQGEDGGFFLRYCRRNAIVTPG